MIPFGEFLPDIAAYGNNGATEAKNVVATAEGFKELNALNTSSSALNGFCRGAFAAQSSGKLSYNYAGTGTKLYQLSTGTWTDQSKASGVYAVSDGDKWEFVKWGEKIIAVGGINSGTPVPPQIISIGAVGSTEFADLGGSPPQARHIAVVKDFVVMGNLYESATRYPSRIRWCGINDETEWTTNPAAQSDYQDLQGNGGLIHKVCGGSYGVIIQERSIQRMDYIGPPLVFSLNETLPGMGTRAPNSIVQYGDAVFFLENSGFKAVSDGTDVTHIGKNKIDDWFFREVDENYMHNIVGAIDRRNNRLVWIFAGTGNADGRPNNGLILDLKTGKWSRFVDDMHWIFDSFGEDYTLEQLDTVSASIDALGHSLDSPVWIGGAINLSGFCDSHKSGQFDGAAMEAILETKEQRLSGQNRTIINKVRPEIDTVGISVVVAPGYRDVITGTVSWGSDSSAERDGNHAMRIDARFHRFRATITGGFAKALGITVVEGSKSSIY